MFKILIFFSMALLLSACSIKSNPVKQKKCETINEAIGGTTALSWFNKHKNKTWKYKKQKIIKRDFYYEIGPQTLPLAIRELKTKSIIELTQKSAKYYNAHYKSSKGMKPYLVRAVFSNYTGDLFVLKDGDSLVIGHYSLGGSSSPSFTPLIINLKTKPKNLILYLSGAL